MKSSKLESKVKELQAALDAARKAEHEAAERELLKLVNRAGCLAEFTKLARERVEKLKPVKPVPAAGTAVKPAAPRPHNADAKPAPTVGHPAPPPAAVKKPNPFAGFGK